MTMRQWPVQDAKAHFSEFLETCLAEGPQMVSKRGEPKAVLVPLKEWESLQKRAKPTLKELLLAPEPRFDLELPDRKQWKLRDIPDFE
jgi:antitoxin Phd